MYQSSRFNDKKDAFSGNIKYFSPHFSYTSVRVYMEAIPLGTWYSSWWKSLDSSPIHWALHVTYRFSIIYWLCQTWQGCHKSFNKGNNHILVWPIPVPFSKILIVFSQLWWNHLTLRKLININIKLWSKFRIRPIQGYGLYICVRINAAFKSIK